jgi:hypothetical protein
VPIVKSVICAQSHASEYNSSQYGFLHCSPSTSHSDRLEVGGEGGGGDGAWQLAEAAKVGAAPTTTLQVAPGTQQFEGDDIVAGNPPPKLHTSTHCGAWQLAEAAKVGAAPTTTLQVAPGTQQFEGDDIVAGNPPPKLHTSTHCSPSGRGGGLGGLGGRGLGGSAHTAVYASVPAEHTFPSQQSPSGAIIPNKHVSVHDGAV